MSVKFKQAFEEIIKMPYFVNEPVRSGKTINGHEDAISIRFEEQGFKRLDNSYFPKLTKKQIEENNITIDGMPLGSFIEQPAGSQSFPDFLVRDFDDRFFLIEAKSNKNRTCPMWNDNVPKQNAIYILSSGQLNKTTVFLGKDVITEDTYTLMEQQAKEIAKIVKKYNNLMNKADKHNRGWIQKSRKQHFQSGGMKKTNYFEHEDQKQCEKNVLDLVE